MRRLSLHPGVWAGFAGLCFSGIFSVLSASIQQPGLWLAGWLAILLSALLLIWGVKLDGEHLWRIRPRTVGFTAFLTAAAIMCLAWYQARPEQPSIDDVSVVFVPEHLDSSRLNGRVVVRSKAQLPITIDEVRIASPDGVINGDEPTTLSAVHPASFDFEEYFWAGARVSFEAHYSVNGKPAPRAIRAEFAVPAHPLLGRGIEPMTCCDAPRTDFIALAAKDQEQVANGREGCMPDTLTDRRSDGSWNRIWNNYARRVFIVDPLTRRVELRSFMRGKWYTVTAPLENTIGGTHRVRFCWHEANGYIAVEADNNYAKFTIDAGKAVRGKLR